MSAFAIYQQLTRRTRTAGGLKSFVVSDNPVLRERTNVLSRNMLVCAQFHE
jgi:hypothetical protein